MVSSSLPESGRDRINGIFDAERRRHWRPDGANKLSGSRGAALRAHVVRLCARPHHADDPRPRALDAGIEVRQVNPACASIIGRHKSARRYGISNHQAAAATIGRRAMNLSESPNRRMADQVTFALPARDHATHVWSFWRQVARKEAAHAAQSRPATGSTGILSAKLRHASRPERCSLDAIDTSLDMPF